MAASCDRPRRTGGTAVRDYPVAMTAHHEDEGPDALDLWVAEVGEDHIVALVEETRRGVADGTIPTFSDKESFLRHLTRTALDTSA